ncbi:hypothetical protein ABCR94_30660 [Streptomyces sp. 21So2-11]|uniref:hypothetical protein n=1 Tax=Streptomyces sp. 21So2-11 TaxID=3144408 RepID=UPI0032192DD1
MLSTTLTPLDRVQRFPDQREAWIEDAHKRWKKALRYRQNEVQRVRVLLYLDATRPVTEAALEMAKRFVLLSRATGRAIAALKDLDTGPLTPPSPGYTELLAADGLGPEAPDLGFLQSQAREPYNTFLRTAADALGENGLFPPEY